MTAEQKSRPGTWTTLLISTLIAVLIAFGISWVYPMIKGRLMKPVQMPPPPAKAVEILGIETGMFAADPIIRTQDGGIHHDPTWDQESWMPYSLPEEIYADYTPCLQSELRRFEAVAGNIKTCFEVQQGGEFTTAPKSYYALTAEGEIWTMEIAAPEPIEEICLMGLAVPLGLLAGFAIVKLRRQKIKPDGLSIKE